MDLRFMKRLMLLLTLLSVKTLSGQTTTLNESFDMCPGGNPGPYGWYVYNPIPSTMPDGVWTCDVSYGRDGTPGISCSGLYGTPLTYHLDTSTLISPALDLSGYPDKIYINFDAKTSNFNLGAKMQFLASIDSFMLGDSPTTFELSAKMMPPISFGNESDWVTHQVELTDYKGIVPLYVGFRYISESGLDGSRWYLDNVHITAKKMVNVTNIKPSELNITLNGLVEDGVVSLRCGVSSTDEYHVSIYDLTGRVIHEGSNRLQKGINQLKIHCKGLVSGIYIVSIRNDFSSKTVKIRAW